ncbi:MAG: cohesin domain-containing protein [bacterium]
MKSKTNLIVFFVVLFTFACDKAVTPPEQVPPNKYDTVYEGFVPPQITILNGPASGSTINFSAVTFIWKGTKNVTEYWYQFDSDLVSGWVKDTIVTKDFLDEGIHTLKLKCRINNQVEEQAIQTCSFTVDAVKGPAFMFFPRKKTVAIGQSFSYEIKAEEVTGFMGCKLVVKYDPTKIRVDSIQAGSYIQSNGASYLAFPSIVDPVAGKASLDLVRLGGNPKSLTGTGTIAILFGCMQSNSPVDITFLSSETVYRDVDNKTVQVLLVDGRVVGQ